MSRDTAHLLWSECGSALSPAQYFDQERIDQVRAHLINDDLGDLTPLDVLELVCDWINMDSALKALKAVEGRVSSSPSDLTPWTS